MKPEKVIKGHKDKPGYGVIMTDGNKAVLYNFDQFGNYTIEEREYIKRCFDIYCEKHNLKTK
jgi:hypothetical protein